MIKKEILKNISIVLSILVLFCLDLLTKTIFTNKKYFENSLVFISYIENYGSSFGIFSNISFYSLLIVILSFFVVIALIYNFKKFYENKYLLLFFVFLISGLLGNTYDRIIFGYVRDFIGLRYLFVFNLADFYITISACLLLWYEFIDKK